MNSESNGNTLFTDAPKPLKTVRRAVKQRKCEFVSLVLILINVKLFTFKHKLSFMDSQWIGTGPKNLALVHAFE